MVFRTALPSPETVFNTYSGNTDDSTGLFPVSADSVVVPGPWTHEVWFPDYCPKPQNATVVNWDADQWHDNIFEYLNVNMTNGQTFPWYCDSNTLPGGPPAGMSRFAIAGSTPSSITLPMVDPFTTTYGMPFMYVYSGANGNPTLYSTITASSVDPSGDSATFPLPSNMPPNAYAFVTYNQNSDGGHRPNAFNLYTVASSQTIAGNPFGVAAAGLTDNFETCVNGYGCGSGTIYLALPVISLYSTNQVLVDNTAINVGVNPTAVAAYSSGPVTTESSGVDGGAYYTVNSTFSGTTRAVVTNSGSNTISILDIVNDLVLANVTVGNQPVALAVSSDGSTAYVANYADSTVTQVNLGTNTATATIAVGGQPTSVALTSAGILWVGGVGFLTEINTQTMGIVATESVVGKTIAALGYSDLESKLVATSTDTSGNVYVEEVNPSAVRDRQPLCPGGVTSRFQPWDTSEPDNPGTGKVFYGYDACGHRPDQYESTRARRLLYRRRMGSCFSHADRLHDFRRFGECGACFGDDSVAHCGDCGRYEAQYRVSHNARLQHASDCTSSRYGHN